MSEHWEKYLKQLEEQWNRVIGVLPLGFSIRVEEAGGTSMIHVSVYYSGPNFREIVQPGGVKSSDSDTDAYVGSISFRAALHEVRSFVLQVVTKTQQELSQL